MFNYILRRLVSATFTLLIISAIAFAIIQLPPGDFTDIYKSNLINQGGLSETEAEERVDFMKVRYGLDQPMVMQYVNWVKPRSS